MKLFCIFALVILVSCQLVKLGSKFCQTYFFLDVKVTSFVNFLFCQASAGLWDDIKSIGKKAEEVGKNAATAIAEGSGKVVDKIKGHLNQGQVTLDEVKDAIKNMANEIADSSSKVVETINDKIEKAASNEEVKKVIAAAQEKIDEFTNGFDGGMKKVADKLKEVYDLIENQKNELNENPPTLDALKQTIINMGGEIADVSSAVFDKIKKQVLNASNIDEIKKVIAAAQEKVENAVTEVEGGLYEVADQLEEMIESIKDQNN